MLRRRLTLPFVFVMCGSLPAFSAPPSTRPAGNPAGAVHALPPAGVEPPAAERAALEKGAEELGRQIDALRHGLKDKPRLLALLPDVVIYYNAVHYPLKYHEFFDTTPGAAKDVAKAKAALAAGMERAKQLREGQTPWLTAGGPRGYESRIDGSVQPYLLIVPKSYTPGLPATPGAKPRYRLDFFCHGRGETLNELTFISGKGGDSVGATAERFIVHPYGRYCNANKFAGEIDLLEILESLKTQYPIDEDRVLISGFSMGGAACWQFATHYTDVWAAAAPGAGFAESAEFLHLANSGELADVPWYEKKLWHWYDDTDYALNLAQLPTVSYAGELDGQKQSGDVMEKAMAAEGLKLERIWGPKTKHAYEKNAKAELDRRIDALVAKGRNPVPKEIHFTTWTLRYNHLDWVVLEGLEKHWERARVDARIELKGDGNGDAIEVKTQNVAGLRLKFAPGLCPFEPGSKPAVVLDGTKLVGPAVGADRSWSAPFLKSGQTWTWPQPAAAAVNPLRKRPGLQGPIDDAFLDRFLIVRPTGKPFNEKEGKWCEEECERAIVQWRKIFRGEPRVKRDSELTHEELTSQNLILFGDASSNRVIASVAPSLPMAWSAEKIQVGTHSYPADHHVLVLVYPNPLNVEHYVVLNSGFTFREEANSSNARQTPKLPDWAVIDLNTPPGPRVPGGVTAAGFFGEKWELPEENR